MALVDVDGWASAQGPGWASFRVDDTPWQGHTGSIAGFRSMALLRAADGLGVVTLTNGPDRPNPVAFAAARALLAAHPSTPAAAPAPAAAPGPPADPTTAPGTIGRWLDPADARRLTVTREIDRLVLTEHGSAPVRLLPTTDPAVWRFAGDGGSAGELVRHVDEEHPDRPERLNVAGWPFQRADD